MLNRPERNAWEVVFTCVFLRHSHPPAPLYVSFRGFPKMFFFVCLRANFTEGFFSRIFLAWYLCVGGALGLWFMLGEEEQAT